MINLKDEADVQIWCDYQEEKQQTSADYFFRLRFVNFCTLTLVTSNYGLDNGYGIGYGWIDGDGHGCGNYGDYGNIRGDGNSYGCNGCYEWENGDGTGFGYGKYNGS